MELSLKPLISHVEKFKNNFGCVMFKSVVFHFLYSLWDTLAKEIQDYIVQLASKEDRLEKSKKIALCEELKTYHSMKSLWRIGHLQCCFKPCFFTVL